MDNLLKYLKDKKLEKDWKLMLFIVSLIIFMYSLFVPMQGIDNNIMQLLSLGTAFLTLGYALSFKDEYTSSPRYGVLCTSKKFMLTPESRVFLTLGFILFIFGLVRLVLVDIL